MILVAFPILCLSDTKKSPFSFKQLFLTIPWLILHQLTFINAIKHQAAVLETMI